MPRDRRNHTSQDSGGRVIKDHGRGTGTDKDKSEAYDRDLLVRTIEDFMKNLPPQQRLYPDLYAERLATAIRKAGFTL